MTPGEMVGLRVAAIRDRQGMSQAQLGEELGKLLGKPWPRQTVSAAEKGQRAFTIAELMALTYVMDTTLVALLAPPAELDRLDMPSGVQLSRQEVVLLGPMGALSRAEAKTVEAAEGGSSVDLNLLAEVMQECSEMTLSWLESDEKRAAQVGHLYEKIVSAYAAVEPISNDEP